MESLLCARRAWSRCARGTPIFILTLAAILWLCFRQERDRAGEPTENARIDHIAEHDIPNYKRVWFAKNLLWMNSQRRGGDFCNLGNHMFKQKMTWQEACRTDDDGDNLTAGAELGDPCCIWKPGMATAYFWELSHPAIPNKPSDARLRMLRDMNCTLIRETGYYPQRSSFGNEEEFIQWFYAEHPEDLEYRYPFLLIAYLGAVYWWTQKTGIWREFLPWSSDKNKSKSMLAYESSVSPSTWRKLLIIVFVFLYLDLASGFMHCFLDNCDTLEGMFASQCRGTQYHHWHPRSQSLEHWTQWLCNPITVGIQLPVCALFISPTFFYEASVEFHIAVFFGAWFWPLTYVFHELAHLPVHELPVFVRWLQWAGLALNPELHKQHHHTPNGTFSVMSGIMDFVPNFLTRYVYDPHDANCTLGVLIALALMPLAVSIYFMKPRHTLPWSANAKPLQGLQLLKGLELHVWKGQ